MVEQENFLERSPNPLFGQYQASNIEEATVVKVHTDEANNVTGTVDVVTIKNSQKTRVPLLFPYASANGESGIFSIPEIGDRCLIGYIAGNQNYVIGFHPSLRMAEGRPSAASRTTSGGRPEKGSFSFKSQLLPGGMEIRGRQGNRIMMHPGGPIMIEARPDLLTFYDTTTLTVTSLARSFRMFSAGGSVSWKENDEESKNSQDFTAELFSKSARPENLEAGAKRGGALWRILFGEKADYFAMSVSDDDVDNQVIMGPNGMVFTSPNFSLRAGDPQGTHVELTLVPDAIAISSKQGLTTLATVFAESSGKVTVTSNQETIINSTAKVTVDAPQVTTTGGLTDLADGGFAVAIADSILGSVKTFVTGGSSSGVHNGMIVQGSTRVTAGT